MAVVLNTSDLVLVGASEACPGTGSSPGQAASDPLAGRTKGGKSATQTPHWHSINRICAGNHKTSIWEQPQRETTDKKGKCQTGDINAHRETERHGKNRLIGGLFEQECQNLYGDALMAVFPKSDNSPRGTGSIEWWLWR